jgi:hypothetical protein
MSGGLKCVGLHLLNLPLHNNRLFLNRTEGSEGKAYTHCTNEDKGDIWKVLRRKQAREIALRMLFGPIAIFIGAVLIYRIDDGLGRLSVRCHWLLGGLLLLRGFGALLLPVYWDDECDEYSHDSPPDLHIQNVSQKALQSGMFPYYTNYMANVLTTDKQIAVISSLCEGSSIRFQLSGLRAFIGIRSCALA